MQGESQDGGHKDKKSKVGLSMCLQLEDVKRSCWRDKRKRIAQEPEDAVEKQDTKKV